MNDPYTLLGRDPIRINHNGSYLTGQRVLVTGAGGSIGSVLCHHIAKHDPAELIMLDRDESALHALQLALTGQALLDDTSTILGDIRDYPWIQTIMKRRRPNIVFHTAALKHQPLLQHYPSEAVKTNVRGTLNVLRAAQNTEVNILVNISTDKAANPTCVLGSSKRIAERLVSWFSTNQYMSVRFGNVFNTRGSVLETFRAQLDADIPLTVTDPDVARYFLTSHEAASLVIHAGSIGGVGEVLIPDMGEPVRIMDIAERLIAANGGHGKITYTGLRTGEKMMEDLLGSGERDSRPNHPLIRQVSVPSLPPFSLQTIYTSSSAMCIAEQLITVCNW